MSPLLPLGVKLFERKKRNVKLTDAVLIFYIFSSFSHNAIQTKESGSSAI